MTDNTTPITLPMGVEQIRQLLPHRYPFLLVDRVIEIVPEQSVVTLKNVTINEPFFNGHFPKRPVMPGVLMLEALAQASALLSFSSEGEQSDGSRLYYFAGIDGARFKRVVEPGDQLILESTITRKKGAIYKYATRATVDGELAVEAELMCTVRAVEA
jgi:3-hydroxyacyl-[acyl-carrier-protein] dehydratase